MIPASYFGGMNHVTVADLNAATGPIGMSASGQSEKQALNHSITGSDANRTSDSLLGTATFAWRCATSPPALPPMSS